MVSKKKIYIKILFIMLVMVTYLIVFVCFDPNDLWGVRLNLLHNLDDSRIVSYNGDKIVTKSPYPILKYVNDIDKNEEYSLILGDSKLTFVDAERISNISKEKYLNLSYGGCALEESILEFWYIVQRLKIKKVIFEIDFHALDNNWRMDRISKYYDLSYIDLIKAYHFDYYNNRLIFESLYKTIKKVKEQNGNWEERVRNGTITREQELNIYKINEEAVSELGKINKYCEKNNIELIYFSPPLYSTIYRLVERHPYLMKELDKIKEKFVDEGAKIYDMQMLSDLSFMDSEWTDASHFTGKIMQQVENNIVGKDVKYMKIWEKFRVND